MSAKGLEAAWQVIRSRYGKSGLETYGRNSPALAVLCDLIEIDMYPPPAILRGVLQAYQQYLAGETLETAFFGRPKRKSGNYARRVASAERRRLLSVAVANLRSQGMTKERAAETLAKQLDYEYSVESIMRLTRVRSPVLISDEPIADIETGFHSKRVRRIRKK